MATKFDAVIVGARCAGAATAMLLARAGARVLVVDKGVYGSDIVSTHALMRGGVLQLQRWGLLPAVVSAGTPAVHSTTFSYVEQDVTVAIEPRYGVDALYAPRRALLDRILVDAARESGVEFEFGVRVDQVQMDEGARVKGIVAGRRGFLPADIVVGADGLYSTIARLVGATRTLEGRYATGVLYSYWQNLQVDGFYWAFRPGAGLGVIPTNDAACCVFVNVPSDRFRAEVHGDPEAAYRRFIREAMPELDARLAAARRVEQVRGFGGHVGFIRSSSGPGWALVGDSAFFKDPLTAHGITDALRDAEFLARAILRGTSDALAEYETTHVDLSKTLFQVTDEIVSFRHSDLDLQQLHRALSSEMSREVRALAALEPLPGPAAC
jgi:flavin-dependent dehydrogenase